jgi:hypothetical protein
MGITGLDRLLQFRSVVSRRCVSSELNDFKPRINSLLEFLEDASSITNHLESKNEPLIDSFALTREEI